MQLPQHHKPSAHSCCSSWIRRSPPPSPPHKKPGGGGRSRYACRLVPLLVLTVYSVVTVLRIPSSSLVVSPADSGNKPGRARVPNPCRSRRAAVMECWIARFSLAGSLCWRALKWRLVLVPPCRARGKEGGLGGAQDPPAVEPEQPRGPRGDAVGRLPPLLRLHQR